MDALTTRIERFIEGLSIAEIPYATIGSHAVAAWIATIRGAPIRSTGSPDLLLRRGDLRKVMAVAADFGLEYLEVITASMLLDRLRPDIRTAILVLWAGEKVKAEDPLPTPTMDERQELDPGTSVVTLAGLVRMKLTANRDKDRVHLRDMIDVGLIERAMLQGLPTELAARLDALLTDAGR